MNTNIRNQIEQLLRLYKQPFQVMIITFYENEKICDKKIIISEGKTIEAPHQQIWKLARKKIKPEMKKSRLRKLARNFNYIQRITIWK